MMDQVSFRLNCTSRGSDWRKERGSDWPSGNFHRLLPPALRDAVSIHEPDPDAAVHEYLANAPDGDSRLVGFLGFHEDGSVPEGLTVFCLHIGGSPNLLARPVEGGWLRHGVLHAVAMMPAFLHPNWCKLLVEDLTRTSRDQLRFELMLDPALVVGRRGG